MINNIIRNVNKITNGLKSEKYIFNLSKRIIFKSILTFVLGEDIFFKNKCTLIQDGRPSLKIKKVGLKITFLN